MQVSDDVMIMPGDTITTTCDYNSSSREVSRHADQSRLYLTGLIKRLLQLLRDDKTGSTSPEAMITTAHV